MAVIKVNNKVFMFDYENAYYELSKSSHPVFQAIENWGKDWIDDQPDEIKDMYYGSFEELHGGSYLEVKGAVQEAIGMMLDWMESSGTYNIILNESLFYKMELDVAFEA